MNRNQLKPMRIGQSVEYMTRTRQKGEMPQAGNHHPNGQGFYAGCEI